MDRIPPKHFHQSLKIALSATAALIFGIVELRSDPAEPVPAPSKNWFQTHLQQRRSLAAGGYRVCLYGDSLTAFWPAQGKGSWQLDLQPFRPFNAGIAGDGIEHIHFRASHATWGHPPPEAFVILAGTNNLGKNPPDDPAAVAEGVLGLVKTLRTKAPDSKVLLLSILPSGFEPGSPLRQRIRETNALLKDQSPASGATWLEVHDLFLDASGKWLPGLTLDGTHLTSRGYDQLAAPVRKQLEKMLPATED